MTKKARRKRVVPEDASSVSIKKQFVRKMPDNFPCFGCPSRYTLNKPFCQRCQERIDSMPEMLPDAFPKDWPRNLGGLLHECRKMKFPIPPDHGQVNGAWVLAATCYILYQRGDFATCKLWATWSKDTEGPRFFENHHASLKFLYLWCTGRRNQIGQSMSECFDSLDLYVPYVNPQRTLKKGEWALVIEKEYGTFCLPRVRVPPEDY